MSAHKQLAVSLDVLLSNYSDNFKAMLGTIVDFKAKLLVQPGTIPKFCKAQSVPLAIKGAIEGELNRIEAAGIVKRMTRSNWAAPIVAVSKKDGGFCICGDYKVMVNWALDIDLLNPSELFATLADGKTFTKLNIIAPSKPQWIVCYTCWWQDIY